MSQTMIRCPKCAADIFGDTAGIATARWREHVTAVHVGADQ